MSHIITYSYPCLNFFVDFFESDYPVLTSVAYLRMEFPANSVPVTSQNEKTTLLGKTKQDYASIVRWMSYANSEILPNLGGWFRPLIGRDPYNKKLVEDHQKAALKSIHTLEQYFLVHTYLVGERPTLADYFTASLIGRGFEYTLDKEWREANPNTTRWYETVTNHGIWKAVVPNVPMCDEAVKYTPPKKEAKPAKPAPVASTPKAEKKPKEEPEDDEEDEPKPEVKQKHPLEAFGKPTLILDDWKRKYSNEETRSVALPWFWEQYNPEDYSLWRVDYKYNEELTKVFMSSNLIGELILCLAPGSRSDNLRWLLQPPRSFPQVYLWCSIRVWSRKRFHHQRSILSSWSRSSSSL